MKKHDTGSTSRAQEEDEGKSFKDPAPSSSFGVEEDAAFLDALAAWPLSQTIQGGDTEGQEATTDDGKRRGTQSKHNDEEVDEDRSITIKLADVLPQHYNGQGLPHDGEGRITRSSGRKRARFTEAEDGPLEQSRTAMTATPSSYLHSNAYDALKFGDFGTYMRNKRAKLKVQESSLKEQEAALLAVAGSSTTAIPASAPAIFQGCTIYINGHTSPPYAELRRIIVLHGGNFMAYLDQKSPVTHIIASNLTPKKRVEFAAYRVVRPEWIMDSVRSGKRLPWHDFKVEADAGGAIGSAKLPEGRKQQPLSNSGLSDQTPSAYLASGHRGQHKSLGARAGGSRATYLADATPWGRVSAQRKLTGLQRIKKAEPSETKSMGDQARLDENNARDSHLLPAEAAEGQEVPASIVEPSIDTSTSCEDAPKLSAPKSSEQPPGTPPNLTPQDLEWLQTLETPPRPMHVAQEERGRREVDSAPSGEGDEVRRVDSSPQGKALESSFTTPVKAKSLGNGITPVTPSHAKSLEASIGTDPPSRRAADAAGHNFPGHPYAKRPSNTHAAKLLASPSWREQNTATSESFLSGFFAKSRLHYLSTWKGELKDLVSQALKDAGREEGSQPLPKGMNRVIMHVDFDSFFVSVGLRDRPDLKDKPIVVCHAGSSEGIGAGENSTSEIASCNYVAREFGIQNGWSLGRARQLCPHVHPIPYDFEGYKDVSIQFYALLLAHADAIEAVSVDEALIDVSKLLHSMRQAQHSAAEGDGIGDEHRALLSAYKGHIGSQGEQWTEEKQLAEALRDEIRRQTRCEASIGIGSNVLQARLATRYAKPGGSYHLRPDELDTFLGKLDIDDLQGVGYNTRRRFETVFGTCNIAELKKAATQSRFVAELGPKLGKQVWDKMFGIDRCELEGAKQRQSVGAAVNYGIRFANQGEAERFVRNLSQEVSNRLNGYKLRGRLANVTVMVRDPAAPVEAPKFLGHGICDVHNRSQAMAGAGGTATNDVEAIFKAAWKSIKSLGADPRELRGIAISCTKLEPTESLGPPRPRAGQSLLNFQTNSTPKKQRMMTAEVVTPSPLRNSSVKRVMFGDHDVSIDQRNVQGIDDAPAEDDVVDNQDEEGEEIQLQPGPFEQVVQSQCQLTPLPDKAESRSHDESVLVPPPKASSSSRARSAEPTLGSQEGGLRGGYAGPSILAPPTMSQIDPSVLSELPPAIRREVLRESKRLALATASASSSRDLTVPGRIATRSSSSSPAKVKKTASPTHQRVLPFVTTRNILPPLASRLRSRSQQKQDGQQQEEVIWIRDPTKVTPAQLVDLGIDADVFAALPSEVQRETLLDRIRNKRGEEVRSKLSARREERSFAQERRVQRERIAGMYQPPMHNERATSTSAVAVAAAAKSKMKKASSYSLRMDTTSKDDPSSYPRAIRQSLREAQLDVVLPPRIRDASSAEEIFHLLRTWLSKHSRQKPRGNDVAKFSAFLKSSVSGHRRHRHHPTAFGVGVEEEEEKERLLLLLQQQDDEEHTMIPGSALDDLEKVHEILTFWRFELIRLFGLPPPPPSPSPSPSPLLFSSEKLHRESTLTLNGLPTHTPHPDHEKDTDVSTTANANRNGKMVIGGGNGKGNGKGKTSSSSSSKEEEEIVERARIGWWGAFESVLEEVNQIVRGRFGGRFRVG